MVVLQPFDSIRKVRIKFVDQEVTTSTLSVEDFDLLKSLSMYPNPSSNNVYFELKNILFDKITITIFDISGRKVKQITSNKNIIKIGTQSLTSGIYFAKIKRDSNNSIVTKKLIIK